MSKREEPARTVAGARTLQAIAEQVAGEFIHRLAPAFRPPARIVCPSDEAEQDVVEVVSRAAAARGFQLKSSMCDRHPPSSWTLLLRDLALQIAIWLKTAQFRRY